MNTKVGRQDDDFEDDDLWEEEEDVIASSSDAEDDDDDDGDWSVDDDEEEDEELKGLSEAQKAKFQELQEDRAEMMRALQEAHAANTRVIEAKRESDKAAVSSIKSDVEREIGDIKRQLEEAIEIDDAPKQVELNEKLYTAIQKKMRVAAAEQEVENPPPAVEETVPRLRQKWMNENPWFDNTYSRDDGDPEMTAIALVAHAQVLQKGVRPDTPEYFRAITEKVKQRFPEKFGGKRMSEDKSQRRGAPANGGAAPISRRPPNKKSKTVRMTDSMRRIAKALNLTDEQYLKSYVKENGE